MTDPNGTTSAPTGATPAVDPNGFEDDADWTRRQQLGLRPLTDSMRGPDYRHPDSRPCPSWCTTGTAGEQHAIAPQALRAAQHSTSVIEVASSVYNAKIDRDYGVIYSTFDLRMKRPGRGQTRIEMILRLAVGDCDPVKMVFNIEDARDVVTVMQQFIMQADASDLLDEASSR